MSNSRSPMDNMATQSSCQLCDGHVKEWEIAQSTLSVLRSKVDELHVRENEAIKRERSAQEQLRASLGREEELFSILNELKRENQSLRATLHSSQIPIHVTSAEPPRVSQDTAEIFPRTPAQLISFPPMPHCTPGNSDYTIKIPTGEAQGVNGAMTPSSGNLETLDNRVISEVVEVGHSLDGSLRLTSGVGPISPLKVFVVETSALLPVIPEVEPLTEISLNPGLSDTGCDVEVQGGNIEEIREASRAILEPGTQERGDTIHQPVHSQHEKESQSYETQPKLLEAIDQHMNHAVQSSHEMPANSSQSSHERPASSGSHKRRRRNLVQAASDEEDEDYVASPPSKQKLFKPTVEVMERANSWDKSSDEMAASSGNHGTRKRKRRDLVQASSDEEDEDYVASPPSKKKLFKASFDSLAASNATPLPKTFQQRELCKSSSSPESPGRAAVVGMEFGGGITVSELVIEEPEMDGKVTQPKHSLNRLRRKESVEFPKSGRAEQPLKVGLRRNKRLSQSSPMPTNEHSEEDEIESSDDDFIVQSSEESSESPELEKKFEETHGPSKPRKRNTNLIDLSNSDSDSGPPLTRNRVRSTRNKRTASGTQLQGSESSESPQFSSSSSDQAVSPADARKVVNLLRPSPDDLEEDDSDDDHDDLNGFIVRESSEESVSDGEEQTSDSDSDEGNSGLQGTVREELVRRRENLIWDFEGDMLIAIENNGGVALQAICALYRQQTKDEKHTQGAIYRNGRGFDKMNAQRGSKFAEFLVDGDESGQLKKSARALETRFPGALRICQGIASHHSKQLFEIYSNNEDPFWGKPTGRAT